MNKIKYDEYDKAKQKEREESGLEEIIVKRELKKKLNVKYVNVEFSASQREMLLRLIDQQLSILFTFFEYDMVRFVYNDLLALQHKLSHEDDELSPRYKYCTYVDKETFPESGHLLTTVADCLYINGDIYKKKIIHTDNGGEKVIYELDE